MKDAAHKRKITRFMKKSKSEVMHGQYIISRFRHLISEEGTFLRLSKGDLKAKTGSEIYRHKTRRYKEHVMQKNITETYSKGRPRQILKRL